MRWWAGRDAHNPLLLLQVLGSQPLEQAPTAEQLASLPYMTAVIKEVLRLWPPGALGAQPPDRTSGDAPQACLLLADARCCTHTPLPPPPGGGGRRCAGATARMGSPNASLSGYDISGTNLYLSTFVIQRDPGGCIGEAGMAERAPPSLFPPLGCVQAHKPDPR
jgi:hypothetical protein